MALRAGPLRGLGKLTLVEGKLFLREPEAVFFTLVFPLLLLFVFGGIYGNEPTPFFGGFGFVDTTVPAYAAIILGITGLLSIPSAVAGNREKKVLRRLRAAPVRPETILGAWVGVYLVLSLLGALLLVLAGVVVYKLRFAGDVLSVLMAFVLSALSFFALGFAIAGLARTVRIATTVGMALFFPMMFLSGATIPWEVLPDTMRSLGKFLPLTHVVQLLQGLWLGEPWGEQLVHLGVLLGTLAVGVIISARTFRWE